MKKIFISSLIVSSLAIWGGDDIEFDVEVLSADLKRASTKYDDRLEGHLVDLLEKVDARSLSQSTKTKREVYVVREKILAVNGINKETTIAVLDFLQKDEDTNKAHHLMSLLNNYLSIV